MAGSSFKRIALIVLAVLMVVGASQTASARRDIRQDECPPDIRCVDGELTPNSDRTSDDSRGDDVIDIFDNRSDETGDDDTDIDDTEDATFE